MVKFEFNKSSSGHFLVVKDDNNGDKKLTIPVFTPIIGAPVEDWRIEYNPPSLESWVSGKSPGAILRSSHHENGAPTKPLNTLYHRISQKKAFWSKPQFGVDFSYIPLYWEWAEDIIRRCRSTLMDLHLLDAVYASMFLYKCDSSFMQHFCESWCPSTNTALTAAGEASISLWDIRNLGGLPINGMFYDEVVPNATELNGSKSEKQSLPSCCRYLFAALQRIMTKSGRSQATFEQWCHFWFRGPERYSKTTSPEAVENFSEFRGLESWSDMHEAFVILDIPEVDRKQTYLAAFLSCWLCAFVLPVQDLGCIRPSVFKPVSQLASGQMISLAIPVLANIYRGLNELSNSSTPGKQRGYFPAHYVYAWTAQYFRSHRVVVAKFAGAQMIAFHGANAVRVHTSAEAKASIHSGKGIQWAENSMNRKTDMKLTDNNNLTERVVDFLLSIRSCYLTLRYDNCHVVEPYSPHRFSRQFGFCQDVPGELKPYSGKILLQDLWSLFQTSIRLGTKSSFLLPACDSDVHSRVTSAFTSWWKSVYASSPKSPSPPMSCSSHKRKATSTPSNDKDGKVKLSRNSLSRSPRETSSQSGKDDKGDAPRKSPDNGGRTIFHDIFGEDSSLDNVAVEEEQKDGQVDFDYVKELEACGNTFASINSDLLAAASDPIVLHAATTIISRDSKDIHDVPTTFTSEAPSFSARDLISEADRYAVYFLVNKMRAKLLSAPLDDIQELDSELNELFDYISLKHIDFTSLQEHVKDYVDRARAFHALEPSNKVHSSLPDLEEQLSSLESRLGEAVYSKKKEEEQIKLQDAEIRKIQQRRDELNKELMLLNDKESELSSALANSKNSLVEHDAAVKDLTISHTSLEKDIATAKETTTKLKEAEGNLKNARTALESLQWEP